MRHEQRRLGRKFAIVVLLVCTGASVAQPAITNLGVLPGGVHTEVTGLSADGTTVVGWCSFPEKKDRAFRWTADEGMTNLGLLPEAVRTYSRAVSADGQNIVGNYVILHPFNGYVDRSFRWTPSAGMKDIWFAQELDGSAPLGISGDGALVVGTGKDGGGSPHAVIWKPFAKLFTFNQWWVNYLYGCSADGAIVIGYGLSTFCNGGCGFRWSNDSMEIVHPLPGSWGVSHARAISANGSVVAGYSMNEAKTRAIRWTAANGTQDLGVLAGGSNSEAHVISADGLVIGGRASSASGEYHAMIWSSQSGMLDVNEYLVSLGVDLTGWSLSKVTGVSSDGTVLAGIGLHEGMIRGWVATGLPLIGCQTDCDANGSLNIEDFVCFQTLFATGDPGADCNASGDLSVDDFVCFQTSYSIGC